MSCTSADAEPADDDGAKPATTSPRGAGDLTSVLLVDDDIRVLKAIRETIDLEPDLFVVGEAGDAGTAYTLAAATNPAVVLVDVLLPDCATGLTLVAVLSRRPDCSVVAMSMRGATRAAALAAGAIAFVEKGSDIDALLVVVRDAARRAR